MVAGVLLLGLHACSDDLRKFNPTGGAVSGATSGSGNTTSTTAGGGGANGTGGANGEGGTGGGYDCGDLQFEGQVCQDCMQQACCQELSNCTSGSECFALRSCFDSCGQDTSCKDACLAKHPAGAEDVTALDDCHQSQCDNHCNGWPVCESGFVTFKPACSNCLGGLCCSEYTACFAEEACRDCILGFDSECAKSTLDDAALKCELDNCQKDCGSE